MMQFFRKNVRSIMLIVVVLFVISCFAGYGMYSGDSRRDMSDGDRVAAKVNGEQVMLSRIEREVAMFLRSNGITQPLSDDDMPALRSIVLDQLAVESEIQKEVKARGVSLSKEEVDSYVREIENSFPTKELFLQAIAREGLDENKFRASLEENLKTSKLFEQVTAPASADETEKSAFYDTYKDYVYRRPEAFLVNVAHFKTEEAANSARKALDSGSKWDDVIEAASGDVINSTPYSETITVPTASLQGDLAVIKDAQMGKATKPVLVVSDDYMIMVKREKQEEGIFTYDEVSADIAERILAQKRQTLQGQFVQELRARASVEVLDQDLFAKNDPLAADEADAASAAIDEIISEDEALDEAVSEDAAASDDASVSGDQSK